MVNGVQRGVFDLAQRGQPVKQGAVVKNLADLQADFQILIRIKRGNARFGRPKTVFAQTLLFEPVKQDVIGHDNLCPVGNEQTRMGNAGLEQAVNFGKQPLQVQGNALRNDVGRALAENAGRQQVQGKLAVFIDDGVTGVGAALKADNNVAFAAQKVGHFAFALVAPVGADNGSDHAISSHLLSMVLL